MQRESLFNHGPRGTPPNPTIARNRYAPRAEIIPDELTLVEGLSMREAQRRLDCTPSALQQALRTGGRLVGGRIAVR